MSAAAKTLRMLARSDKGPARRNGVLAFARFVANGALIWTMTFQAVDRSIGAKRVRIGIAGLGTTAGRNEAAAVLRKAKAGGFANAASRSRACYARKAAV